MTPVISLPMSADVVAETARLVAEHIRSGGTPRRTAVVFGGRRPSLFLRRALGARTGGACLPPICFSMDEFAAALARGGAPVGRMPDSDAAHILFSIVSRIVPAAIAGRERFPLFSPWAAELLVFLERIEMEDVPDADLAVVEKNAEIGYALPEAVNAVLARIGAIRAEFRAVCRAEGRLTRGMVYREAAAAAANGGTDAFDRLFVGAPIALRRTEIRIVRAFLDAGRATVIFQGDPAEYGALRRTAEALRVSIVPPPDAPDFSLGVRPAPGIHGQVAAVAGILREMDPAGRRRAVVVLPKGENVVPLLTGIASFADDFNVSLGYPLARSAVAALLLSVLRARTRRCGRGEGGADAGGYRRRDYLDVLRHLFVKNLDLAGGAETTRVLVHKIEEALDGAFPSPLAGATTVVPPAVEACAPVHDEAMKTLGAMGTTVERETLPAVLAEIHRRFFGGWESARTVRAFAERTEELVDLLVEKSPLEHYPPNLSASREVLAIAREFARARFAGEEFPPEDIVRLFEERIARAVIPFAGSPLRGLQILGLEETRSLSFETVIVMDADESALPRLRAFEPLVPRDVLAALGIDPLAEEDDIQRHQFFRLVAGAKTVHIVRDENADSEPTRYLEELLWERQRTARRLDAVPVRRQGFRTVIPRPAPFEEKKTPEVMAALAGERISAKFLDAYLACPARFYFSRILRLEERAAGPERERIRIGLFFHGLLAETYRGAVGGPVSGDVAETLRRLFETRFERDLAPVLGSAAFLTREVARARLAAFAAVEKGRAGGKWKNGPVARVAAVEDGPDTALKGNMPLGGAERRFVCKLDRVDELDDGSHLLLDYKTSGGAPTPAVRLGRPADRETMKRSIRSFQLPLYLLAYRRIHPAVRANAAAWSLADGTMHPFAADPDAAGERLEICREAMDILVAEIFDEQRPFVSDRSDERRCERCPFARFCA